MKNALLLLVVASSVLLGCLTPDVTPAASPSPSNTPSPLTGEFTAMPETASVVVNGDNIAVDYIGTTDDGKVFDTSLEAEAKKAGLPLRPSYAPLEFTVGAGQMIAGFDAGVVGMKVGETKKIRIPAEQAYGVRDASAVMTVPRPNLPADAKEGDTLYTPQGRSVVIVSMNTTEATLDFNHPLAGKALTFQITVRKISKA